jgi:hypothetical protein
LKNGHKKFLSILAYYATGHDLDFRFTVNFFTVLPVAREVFLQGSVEESWPSVSVVKFAAS